LLILINQDLNVNLHHVLMIIIDVNRIM